MVKALVPPVEHILPVIPGDIVFHAVQRETRIADPVGIASQRRPGGVPAERAVLVDTVVVADDILVMAIPVGGEKPHDVSAVIRHLGIDPPVGDGMERHGLAVDDGIEGGRIQQAGWRLGPGTN